MTPSTVRCPENPCFSHHYIYIPHVPESANNGCFEEIERHTFLLENGSLVLKFPAPYDKKQWKRRKTLHFPWFMHFVCVFTTWNAKEITGFPLEIQVSMEKLDFGGTDEKYPTPVQLFLHRTGHRKSRFSLGFHPFLLTLSSPYLHPPRTRISKQRLFWGDWAAYFLLENGSLVLKFPAPCAPNEWKVNFSQIPDILPWTGSYLKKYLG